MRAIRTALTCSLLLLFLLPLGNAQNVPLSNRKSITVLPNTQSQFLAVTHKVLAGPEVVVVLHADGQDTLVIAMPSGVNRASALKRAELVAGRMQQLAQTDPRWWEDLQIGMVNHEFAVGCPSKKTWIITADHRSATKCGFRTDAAYAAFLLNQIKTAVAPKLR